jgi:hypothetical protein
LQELDVAFTSVTDAGLASLARLKNLTSLSVEETACTQEGVRRLQAVMPKLEVVI